MCKEIEEKEDDSMMGSIVERKGYRRLNLRSLSFMDNKKIDKENIETVTPIQWSKEVLSGKKQVVIKKQ